VSLLSKQLKSSKKNDAANNQKSKMSSNAGSSKSGHVAKMSGKPTDADKFKLYFDFKAYINAIRPHQVCVCLFKLF